MAVLNNSNAISPSGYDINNSLRFRASASASLSRTPSSNSTSTTIRTFSAWVKRGLLSSSTRYTLFYQGVSAGSGQLFLVEFFNDSIRILYDGAVTYNLVTTAVFRDPSAWYHIVVTSDTTQATAANRTIIYVNGVSQTITGTQPTQNYTAVNGTTSVHNIGAVASVNYFDGYMAEINFIDGQALTPSSFGSTSATTGVWQPAKYTGTYGTNGFYLKFSDIATTSGSNAGLGKDFSGNTNYWTTNNISVTAGTTYDAMIDSPTLTSATVANYPVWNPLKVFTGNLTLSNANLTASDSSTSIVTRIATMSTSTSGKYYFEVTATAISASNGFIGVADSTYANANAAFQLVGSYRSGGQIYNLAGTAQTAGNTYTSGDIVGVAVDIGAGTVQFYKNNVAQGSTPSFTFTAGTELWSFVATDNNAGTKTFNVNFGQRPFSYTPPTGFVRLNTFNLPDSAIKKGNTVMDATTYTGTGASLSVTNASAFKPDFVWVKGRNNTYSNVLEDSVRGATKYLLSDSTAAETTDATTLTSFNSNGFSLGSNIALNQSTFNFVGWQWQAGQGSTSSNTSGTITSTVSVNATAGFSVVTWAAQSTARTVGHSLGVAPSMIIMKDRSGAIQWFVYHASIGAGKYLTLNTTAASATNATVFSTAPTSSVFDPGTGFTTGNGYGNQVAYCWAEIAGFSKFGSYTGNGSTDGPFVYTGFRPKWIMVKRTDSTGMWSLWDTSRNTFNSTNLLLQANTSDAETSGTFTNPFDLLSNGFKLRDTSLQINASGGTYIYAAYAENPFKNANAR
jgi:hypothetical protein